MRKPVLVSVFAALVLVAGLSGCAGVAGPSDETVGVVEKVAPLPGGLPREPINVYEELGEPSPHWVMYLAWDSFELGRLVILDADTAEMKAHISTGAFASAQPSRDGGELYVAETLGHGPARLRKDYISVYDTTDYSLSRTLEMTENRRALMGPVANTALVGEGRFLVVFDFTPRTGLSVIDTKTLSLVNTIDTPGCFLVFPTGARGVSMLCGDGRLLTVHLDAEGGLAKKLTSEPFFDPDVDPIMENGVPVRGTWYFPSRRGDVYPVDLSGEVPVLHKPWPLADAADSGESEAEAWLPGAPIQMAASNSLRDELYVLMHPVAMSGGEGDFAFPGTEVWVYDVAKQSRVRRLVLDNMAMSIYVTADAEPMLVTNAIDPALAVASQDGAVQKMIPTLEIYDALTGEYLRRFADPGLTVVSITGAPGSGNKGDTQ